jgi:DNA-binding response OmpR family regulator
VTAKASPEEALAALRDNPERFELVMTVLRRQGPGIDGFELLREAAERYPVICKSCVICVYIHGSSS